jgi:hypothetical protein
VVSKLLQQSRRVRFRVPSTTVLTTRGRRKRERRGEERCRLHAMRNRRPRRGAQRLCAGGKKKTSCCVEKERGGQVEKRRDGWKARRRSQLGLTSLCLASSDFPLGLHLHFLTSIPFWLSCYYGSRQNLQTRTDTTRSLVKERILDSYTYDGWGAASGDWHPRASLILPK